MALSRTQIIYLCVAAIIIVFGAVAAYAISTSGTVAIDTASIEAPLINLTSGIPGRLDAVYVHVGDAVAANESVAEVGTQIITSKVAGIVVAINDTLGAQVTPGAPVVEMIAPSQLRLVGRIDETKGLSRIHVGDPVTFTVDAFAGQTFTGVIDEVAPTSNQSGIVFNISDQRQVQQFDVKARFNIDAYPQLKNGMSARMWIRTNN